MKNTQGYDLHGVWEILQLFPMYVVFYNGFVEKTEKFALKLSDALERSDQYAIGKAGEESAKNIIDVRKFPFLQT